MRTKTELLESMATIMLTTQSTERILKFVLVYVLQDGKPLTRERMDELDGRFDKRTLGALIRELKDRAEFRPEVIALMDEFVKHRNQLIHRFDETGFDLNTPEGLSALDSYLASLHDKNWNLIMFLSAICRSWASQIGLPSPMFQAVEGGISEELAEIEKELPNLIKEK